jgi:diguanylate cyclase (GGDEF)-like protein/putative nucleotidyltransferase with HDIG domain
MGAIRRREDLTGTLAQARQRIAELESRLASQVSRDPLADSLLNLRAFRTQLEMDVLRAKRYHRPLSVALLDIDGFRQVNLRHGYARGDEVLVSVAEVISESTRVHDLACRMGADEFALLLPETGSAAAMQAAERLLLEFEDLRAGPLRGISVSIGIAALESKESPERLLASAGEALEQARAGGGRQVALYDGASEEGALEAAHKHVVAALASALQERDSYTGDHSESVVEVAGRVAQALGLDSDEVNEVRTAALLHDIGKVGIPDEILHKPGPLDDREWELMRRHPVIGERILRAIPGLGSVARIVRHEHERWDGRGYPDELAGDDAPIGSRIILACDAYHAMTSDRPYRSAMSHAEAVAELTRNAGTQFDPQVAQALVGYLYGRRQSGVAGMTAIG